MAVVQGVIKEDGTVDAPIGRHKTDRKKMCVTTENSREAITHYFVEQTIQEQYACKAASGNGKNASDKGAYGIYRSSGDG